MKTVNPSGLALRRPLSRTVNRSRRLFAGRRARASEYPKRAPENFNFWEEWEQGENSYEQFLFIVLSLSSHEG